MNKPKNITVIKKISKVLKTTDKKLLKTDDFQKFETWDSLVHLEILSILEKNYGGATVAEAYNEWKDMVDNKSSFLSSLE